MGSSINHWLRVSVRIQYKIALLAHKVLLGNAIRGTWNLELHGDDPPGCSVYTILLSLVTGLPSWLVLARETISRRIETKNAPSFSIFPSTPQTFVFW
jgi:hypothetical protein